MSSKNSTSLTSQTARAEACLTVALHLASLACGNQLSTWDIDADESLAEIFRQIFHAGGLEAVDDFIAQVNACLQSAGASHRLFPGCVCQQTGDRPEVLTIATCTADADGPEYNHQIQL